MAMGETGVRIQALLTGAVEAAIRTPPQTDMANQMVYKNLVLR